MEYNNLILNALSIYLNEYECSITPSQIKKVMECGVDELFAYKLLLSNYLAIENQEIIDLYFDKMVHKLEVKDYIRNPYYENIPFNNKKIDSWQIKKGKYKPYELFVFDDFKYEKDLVIPQVGYFNEPFYYLAVYDNDRLWMSITPNEINTMKDPINNAKGNVLTFGLGLGYFAYMCALKDEVKSITIIEKDERVIKLFKDNILPYFVNIEKINIINEDAYVYLSKMNDDMYDYVFVDIYHDAGDGKEVYLKMNQYRNRFKKTIFEYWIYNTIKHYL
jgi:hypothetical protein